MTTDKADTLALILRSYGMADDFEREYKFHPSRDYRVDFAHVGARLALEVDGGNHMVRWSKKMNRHVAVGRHTQDKDMTKLNEACAMGWRVLHFSPAMLDDPDGVVRVIRAAMETR